jgi:hypothetical protein
VIQVIRVGHAALYGCDTSQSKMAAEKLLPFGRKVAIGTGLVFSAWGAIMLLG